MPDARFAEQMERLETALRVSGFDDAEMGSRVAIRPDTIRKARKGYQPMSESAIRSIERVAADESNTPRARLRIAMREAGLTCYDLARKMSYEPGVIQNLVFGTGRLSMNQAEAIVRVLPALSLEDLIDGSDDPPILREDGVEATYGAKPPLLPPGVKGRYVPLLSLVQAGHFDAGHTDDYYQYGSVLALNVDDRAAFAVKVSGNSMEPVLREGDYVICSPKEAARNGDCVVVRTTRSEAMVKFFRRAGQVVTLESANREYPVLKFPLKEIAGVWPVVQHIAAGRIRSHAE